MTIYNNKRHADIWNQTMKRHAPGMAPDAINGSFTKPKKARKHDEKDLQSSICDYLRQKNIFFWRNNTGVSRVGSRYISYGSVGSPDVLAIKNGTLYGIEVKSSTGRQSEAQKTFQKNMEQSGAIYILATSIDDVISKI